MEREKEKSHNFRCKYCIESATIFCNNSSKQTIIFLVFSEKKGAKNQF